MLLSLLALLLVLVLLLLLVLVGHFWGCWALRTARSTVVVETTHGFHHPPFGQPFFDLGFRVGRAVLPTELSRPR